MSRAFHRQTSSALRLSFVCPLIFAAILLLSGCSASSVPTTQASSDRPSQSSPVTSDSPATTVGVMTTSPWAVSNPEASEAARLAVSDWPSGIAMLVLSTGYELYAVDHTGIRWSQEMQTRPDANATSTVHSREIMPFDGVAVSNSQEFIAYVDHATEIVVRSIFDGTIVSRAPYQAEGETQLRGLSSDGNLAVLASVPPDLQKGTTGDRLPWRVTVLDMRSGQATIERPLEDLVKERTADDPKAQFTLYSLDWLPEDRLVVGYVGWWGYEVYTYDLGTDAMEPIPGVGLISSVSDSGTVYGGDVNPKGAQPQVWDGTATQALELDADSGYALWGAFNSAGNALAIQVMSSTYEPHGWQLFRLSEGQWRPSGPLAENSWMKAAPRALSEDATRAWTSLEGGQWESGAEAALLSYDFQTGVWQEWLGPEDLQVDLGPYHFEAIIPEK